MDRITVKEYRGILKILRSEYFFFSRSFFLLKCLEEKKNPNLGFRQPALNQAEILNSFQLRRKHLKRSWNVFQLFFSRSGNYYHKMDNGI